MKLCQITIIVCTGLLKNKDNFYANAQGENKTISSDQTNKTIAGLIKTHYSQLDKVTNQTIRDELLKLNATVTGCVGLLDVFITQAYLGVATYLAAELAAIVLLVTQFQTSIATILTGISGSVTDTSLNTSKVAECEKVAFAAFDAIIKNASTFSDKCFKNFSDYETKSFTVQIKLVFAAIVLCAQNPLANISSCMKINKISDAKGMDSTTNCTRDSFLTCITFVSVYNLILSI